MSNLSEKPEGAPRKLTPLEQAIAEKFGISPEEIPAISLDFYFVVHKRASDAEPLRKPIEKADVVLTEFLGKGDELREAFLEEITHGLGVYSAYQQFNAWEEPGSFRHALYEMLENTGKVALPLDVPFSHPSSQVWEKVQTRMDYLVHFILADDPISFSTATQEFEELGKLYGKDFQAERDEYIKKEIIPTVIRALEKQPELLTKDKLSIMVQFGVFHTPISHGAKEQIHADTTHSLPYSPYTFSPDLYSQVGRFFRFDSSPSRELVMKAFLYFLEPTFFAELRDKGGKSEEEKDTYLRRVFDLFSPEEVERFYRLKITERNPAEANKLILDKVESIQQ